MRIPTYRRRHPVLRLLCSIAFPIKRNPCSQSSEIGLVETQRPETLVVQCRLIFEQHFRPLENELEPLEPVFEPFFGDCLGFFHQSVHLTLESDVG